MYFGAGLYGRIPRDGRMIYVEVVRVLGAKVSVAVMGVVDGLSCEVTEEFEE